MANGQMRKCVYPEKTAESKSRKLRFLNGSVRSVILIPVSLEHLKDEAAHLSVPEQRELIAFLIARQTEQDENFKRVLTQKIDDKDSSHWVELDELQKRYAG